jgi:hypothetical protein
MKRIKVFIVGFFILFTCLPEYSSSANAGLWETGIEKTVPVYGVGALISSPDAPLNSIVGDGISNWVSTIQTYQDGERWIQAGWEYIPGVEDQPTQYVEVCPAFDTTTNNCGTSYSKWNSAVQEWGTDYQYWVYKLDNSSIWCGFTGDPGKQDGIIMRKCYADLHGNPSNAVNVTIRSESHDDTNSIETTFDQIVTKHVDDESWYFLSQSPMIQYIQSPYNFLIINPFYTMRTFREVGNNATPTSTP